MLDPQGWLNVYKPINISSFSVIRKIKKKFNLYKIGHAGTLDPLAEGILPIAIGKTTKLISFINQASKEYIFEIKWGEQTSTDDKEGKIINKSKIIPTIDEIEYKLNEFKGLIKQTPPKASAVKINGERAYKLLRSNDRFEIQHKLVHLYNSKIISDSNHQITKIKVECGKGFYIRSLARDLADSLNTKGHIYSLKRIKVGKFDIKNAILLDDLLKIRQTLQGFRDFHSSVSMLDDILAYEIDDDKEITFLSQGKSINIDINKLLNPSLNSIDRKIIFLTNKGSILSFGKLDGNLFKPIKVLI